MNHMSELERMVGLIALSATVTKQLAKRQSDSDRKALIDVADDLERVGERLVDILFPQRKAG